MSNKEDNREELRDDLPDEELEALYRDHGAIRNWDPLANEVASYYLALQDKGLTEKEVLGFAMGFQSVLVGLMWRQE